MAKIIYAATPFRLDSSKGSICDFIQLQGHFPIHPFYALPLDRYNYNNFSREEIMKVCYGMINLCDELWIFGLGSGSIDEWKKAGELKLPRRSLVKQFDPKWEEYLRNPKHARNAEIMREILDANNQIY